MLSPCNPINAHHPREQPLSILRSVESVWLGLTSAQAQTGPSIILPEEVCSIECWVRDLPGISSPQSGISPNYDIQTRGPTSQDQQSKTDVRRRTQWHEMRRFTRHTSSRHRSAEEVVNRSCTRYAWIRGSGFKYQAVEFWVPCVVLRFARWSSIEMRKLPLPPAAWIT